MSWRRGHHARWTWRLPLVCAAVTGSALALSACGGDSDALGNQACAHVAQSLSLFAQSQRPGQHNAAALAEGAGIALRDALRPAALAASSSGDWQALATTISESSRVPERNLVQALSAECASSPAGPRT